MRIERTPFTSSFYVWEGVSAMFYSSHITPFHSHNTLQLVFDIQEKFKLRTTNSDWQDYKSLIIKDNTIHQLDTNQSAILIIYLDPSLNIAKQMKSSLLQDCEICALKTDITDLISLEELQESLLRPSESLLRKLIQKIIQKLGNGLRLPIEDYRVKEIKEFVIISSANLRIQTLARKVFLSESRLRALFKKQTGVSIHRYILSNRLIQGISLLMNGCSIADAAFFAGFEDSSHLHKAMTKHFCVRPSEFIKNNKEMKIVICNSSPMRLESAIYNEQFRFQKNIVLECVKSDQ